MNGRINLLETARGRRILFAALYFGEGAPIGFVWWALPTLLRERGAAIDEITALTALLALPWALKFLWAPLVDVVSGPRFTLRGWILATQLAMAMSLLLLAQAVGEGSFETLRIVLVLHAFAASTQDVVIDALAIRSTSEAERGSVNAWMQAGMLTGRAAFGGGALLVAAATTPRTAVTLLAATVAATTATAMFYRDVTASSHESSRVLEFRRHLARAFSRRTTWFGLAFAAAGAAAFEAAGLLVGPMLLDSGVPTTRIGAFLSLPSALLMIVGGLVAGRYCGRPGPRPTLVASGIGVAALVAALPGLAAAGDGAGLWAVLSALYFGIGAFTVASYALFMDLTDRELGSTQFSTYMAATNLCEAWAGHLAGVVASSRGYGTALGWMALASVAALPLLSLTRTARQRRPA